MSLSPIIHRLKIPGISQPGWKRTSSLRIVKPKSRPDMALHGTGVSRILEKNA